MLFDIIKKSPLHNLKWVFLNATKWVDDEPFLKFAYRLKMGKTLDLEHPKTFNEKIQWLKLHDRKPEYTTMVDKYLVKKYVADIIGEEFIIPTLGKWDKFDDIDFDKLPNQFVLKCNHDSGSVVVVKDKSKFDDKARAAARKKLDGSLKRNYFWIERGWAYKNIVPCIIAEKYMEDDGRTGLTDYKIHCFNGEPKFVIVFRDRFGKNGMTDDFFDVNWQHLPVARPGHPFSKENISKPENFDLMIEFAKKLSDGTKFLRVDFYNISGKIYFGELTFYPAGGMSRFEPEEWDEKIGEWIRLE